MDGRLSDIIGRFHDQSLSRPSPATCLLKVNEIPPSLIKSLSRAAAALYRTDPWTRLRPSHLFSVRVAKDPRQPFPCAHFLHTGNPAIHMFRSDHDARTFLALQPHHPLPPDLQLLRVVFQPEPMLCPSNKRLVRSLSLEPSGPDRFPVIDVARGLRFRNPTVEELRYVYAFMKAIALVHPLLELADNVAHRRGRLITFYPLIETVDVQWPPQVSAADIVAVTISHPPGQAYEEKKQVKHLDQASKEEVHPVEANADWILVRQCTMCGKDVQGDQSCFCGHCFAVVYCSPVCQKQHWKEAHKSVCGLYKSMMEREEELATNVFTFSCFVEHPCEWLESMGLHHKGMWRRMCSCYSHSPFGAFSSDVSDSWGGVGGEEFQHDSTFTNVVQSPILLSGWSEYYNLRSLPMSSPVAAILSHPLTVYHILTNLVMSSKNRLIKGKEVVVHYLGPERELDWMPAFAEISHMLNGLGSIHIVMIGPEVPSNLSGKFVEVSGRVRVNVVRGIYQEESSYLPSPHVVVALNCGLENYTSWGGALELIKSMNVPAFFTDQSEILCANAKQVLRSAGLHITHPVTPNPFRSALKDQAPSSNLPSFSNCFLFGANR